MQSGPYQGWERDQVLQALGLDAGCIRKLAVGQHLNKGEVVRRLKQRHRDGKSLAGAAVAREDLRLYNAAHRQFGSHGEALRASHPKVAPTPLVSPSFARLVATWNSRWSTSQRHPGDVLFGFAPLPMDSIQQVLVLEHAQE